MSRGFTLEEAEAYHKFIMEYFDSYLLVSEYSLGVPAIQVELEFTTA